MFNLADELPRLLPKAIAWAQVQSAEVLASGVTLGSLEIRLAKAVGVQHAQRIRLLEVDALPVPEDPELQYAALQTRLLGPETNGLTLGYAILIVKGHWSNRLISHECRHVYQYEAAGSIATFLPVYLQQIAIYGYDHAPLEIDARRHERDIA